jgi:hypothetical protein
MNDAAHVRLISAASRGEQAAVDSIIKRRRLGKCRHRRDEPGQDEPGQDENGQDETGSADEPVRCAVALSHIRTGTIDDAAAKTAALL